MDVERAPQRLVPTVSQTVGPFFHLGLDWLFATATCDADCPGRRIAVRGRVLDGDRQPVSDALVEVWHADADGRYASADTGHERPAPGFRGYARMPTGEDGAFRFDAVKPGPVVLDGGAPQAPHVAVRLFMRGLLRPLVTRFYFDDEPSNADDLVLAFLPASRRATLVAARVPEERELFEWNVLLQGDGETVFFEE